MRVCGGGELDHHLMHRNLDRCGVFVCAGKKPLHPQVGAELLLEPVSLLRVVCSHLLGRVMVRGWLLRISPFSEN